MLCYVMLCYVTMKTHAIETRRTVYNAKTIYQRVVRTVGETKGVTVEINLQYLSQKRSETR